MADLPLNTFGNQAVELTTTPQVLYTAPLGITTIILGAQASNVSGGTASMTLTLVRADTSEFILLNNFDIPVNDAAEVTTGKLVLTEGESLKAVASDTATINLILSFLETSNE
jgi:hypothetical protein